MAQGSFDTMVPDAVAFLEKLAKNNTRDWFQAHKADYEAAVKRPGIAFADVIAERLEDLTGTAHTPKLFRVHRDVRFSKDKTPYHTHLHLLWSSGSGPGFFFGASPDNVTAGCGAMGFDKRALERYRQYVDTKGDAVADMLSDLVSAGYRLDDPELKRVPAPYDKAHLHSDLLRRKSLVVWRDVSGKGSPEARVLDAFSRLLPVRALCAEVMS